MKRVYCLYRVSTLGQVEKDDIPMQRQACHAFAEKQGWQIIAEFSEKGVSGFKQSAEQREALVAIKQAAILKKFDVLLVFMFDRLGRRDDETPFVVEWFVKNGIAVWSVMEGEQRFENHVDKLLNYIRFWQSSGESIKTALRTRVRMEQLIQENGYVGGTAPYGYRLCKLGRVNKRGFEVHDLLMDPAKAEVIKTIFRLYCEEDMGPYRIAVHLTQQGELTRRGTQWNAASVRNILGNAIYTGIRTYGAIQTERFSHLQIVSDELYLCAQQKLQACRLEEPRPLRSQHWDAVLLKDRPYYMQIMLIVILLFSMTISAAAAEDMWEAADRIIKDVYTKIAGISTVLAGLMSAVAVVGAKVSNNQHKTDQAWDWLKRIWLCWIVINGIGAFLAYVQPLFDGLATLDPDGGTSTQ